MAESLSKRGDSATSSSGREQFGLTIPAILLGVVMGIFSVLLAADQGGAGGGVIKADGNTILHGVGRFFSATAPVAPSIWAILLAVMVINPLMRRFNVKFQFTTRELIVASTIASLPWGLSAYVMLGSHYPQHGIGWMQAVSGHHVARNRPASYFEPFLEKSSPLVHIQDWEVFENFIEGGHPMNWGAWFLPTLTACLFIIAILWVSLAIAVLVRRRWTDQEHLRYPVAVVRMSLIEMEYPSSMAEGTIPADKVSLLKNGLFWIGIVLGALEVSGVLKSIWSWWPIEGRYLTYVSKAWQQNVWKRQPFTVVFGHTANASIEWISVLWFVMDMRSLFSVVLWHRVVLVIFHAICYFNDWFSVRTIATTRLTHAEPWQVMHDSTIHRMRVPAFIFAAFSALWLMRNELKEIFRTAFSKDPEKKLDDSDEPMSYRTAIITGGIAFLYMVVYGTLFHMNFFWSFLTMAILFLVVPFVRGRMRAEYGIPGMGGVGWNLTNGFFRPLLGKELVGDNLVGIGSFARYGWAPYCVWSGIALEGFVMMDRTSPSGSGSRRERNRILHASVVAILVGLMVIVMVIVPIINEAGMMRQPRHVQYAGSEWFVNEVSANRTFLSAAWDFQMNYVYLVLVSGLFILISTWGLSRFVWWPLHPFGFPIAISESAAWTPTLWVWALKSLVLRYGGMRLYHKISPFMLGTLVGTSLMQLFALILAALTIALR